MHGSARVGRQRIEYQCSTTQYISSNYYDWSSSFSVEQFKRVSNVSHISGLSLTNFS